MHYLSFVLVGALAGGLAALLGGGKRWARVLGRVSLVVLFLWCWPPFARLTSSTLEDRSLAGPPVDPAGSGAIVVLSGSILLPNPGQPVPLPGFNTYLRCVQAASLHRRTHLPVLASGGLLEGPAGPVSAAQVMRDFLLTQGVDPVWTEEQSLSTAENAAYTARLLQSKGVARIVLVTEAYHMPRAARCFEKLGIVVVRAPCGFNTTEPIAWTFFLPDYRALKTNEDNFHEWVSLVWYRMRGVA